MLAADCILRPSLKSYGRAVGICPALLKSRRSTSHCYPWCTFGEPIIVQTKKLDTWCREESVKQIDLIWADVQGAEENLIRGGREALRRTLYLFTEYSNRELYEGQIGLRKIRDLLPDFDVVYRFEADVLLKNKRGCAHP